ncbi:antibiotic biosynthesis monooxygenase (ABM) superfamily enzyme [Mesoflavibacter sabulilitoris]|uniref:hypothetical protein n=1 Tax=Mesoflavibacter zeaxanthinifaciens TaxID=393060 RepID=UPI0015E70714|nr:hypothetical protein [Mesoflavibacter zeaxanthinifaciens]MBB3123339.1 antibiotic biosynthesis monooxygenase (ABM) superfamily enzyme [Mesoflavibacter zeaxanthinifaciens subsp. sabulilitoris]
MNLKKFTKIGLTIGAALLIVLLMLNYSKNEIETLPTILLISGLILFIVMLYYNTRS